MNGGDDVLLSGLSAFFILFNCPLFCERAIVICLNKFRIHKNINSYIMASFFSLIKAYVITVDNIKIISAIFANNWLFITQTKWLMNKMKK
ncbi:hypothetical protein [Pseudoalteromonas nigrifaciens]|uniref:hypothetical protein n=2 Tax=Pseudoalteromonas nigrifaciens TaxID=28109 RepID=UPI001866B6F1|nr:hypothetical protein [Pseudoalteromonas nigrifaciens]